MADIPAQPDPQPGYAARYDYRVDVLRRRNLVTAHAGPVELARSDRTLLVDEQDHGLVFYFPREAVDLSALVPIDHTSRCPYKGIATYWALATAADRAPIAWSYESPYPQVALIAGYIAFYQDRVTVALGTAPFTPGGK
jgi:uncharacterized protein (DUF427 family)